MGTVAPGVAPQTLSSSAAKYSVVAWTFSGSYTTGGEAITAGQCGLSSLFAITATITGPAASVVSVVYNRSTGKLQAFTASAEVAAAVNTGALTCDLVCIGTY